MFKRELLNAVRQLLRRPRLTISVVLLLVLGAAPCAALVSVMLATRQSILAPYPDAEQLVLLRVHSDLMNLDLGPSPVIERTLETSHLLDSVGAFTTSRALVSKDASADGIDATIVTANSAALSVLGVQPITDRPLSELQTARGVLLPWQYWTSPSAAIEAKPPVEIYINGREYPVLGLLPDGFKFPERGIRAWVIEPTDQSSTDVAAFTQKILIGRAKHGASLTDIQSQLNQALKSEPATAALTKQIALVVNVQPLRDLWLADGGAAIRTVLFAVIALLAAALANASALFVLSAWGRRHEMAVETSFGANPSSLMLRAAIKVSVIAFMSLAVAIPTTFALLAALASAGFIPPEITPRDAFANGGYLANSAIAVLAAATLLAAVLLAGPNGRDTTAFSAIRAKSSTRGDNVAVHVTASLQVALGAIVLYVVALMASNVQALSSGPFGYNTENVHVIRLATYVAASDDAEVLRRRAGLTQFVGAMRQLPAITAASLTMTAPLGDTVLISKVLPSGQHEAIDAQAIYVDDEYFKALQIPLQSGRSFNRDEVTQNYATAIIDSRMAERYFGSTAVGASVNIPTVDESRRTGTVVGVAATARHRSPDRDDDYPTIFLPTEAAYRVAGVPEEAIEVIFRENAAAPSKEQLSQLLSQYAQAFRIETYETLDQRIISSAQKSVQLRDALVFLTLAVLALSAAGNYAVFGYGVESRMREYGVRKALGASELTVFSMVLRRAFIWMSAALTLCIPMGALAGMALARDLQLPIAFDVLALGGATVISILCGLGAVIAPARKASAHPAQDCLRST